MTILLFVHPTPPECLGERHGGARPARAQQPNEERSQRSEQRRQLAHLLRLPHLEHGLPHLRRHEERLQHDVKVAGTALVPEPCESPRLARLGRDGPAHAAQPCSQRPDAQRGEPSQREREGPSHQPGGLHDCVGRLRRLAGRNPNHYR